MVITIFGSTGDLSKRKLFPALYNLFALHRYDDDFKVVAIGRKDYTQEGFVGSIQSSIQEFARLEYKEETFQEFKKTIHYFKMELTHKEDYDRLNKYYKQEKIEKQSIYLALSPIYFHQVIEGMKQLSNIQKCNMIIEKPFGQNTQDMKDIYMKLKQLLPEEQIYYIDHYLGKEMIQNIKTIRFKNALFKQAFHRDMIESIQISALENEGILNRGSYYDKSGALKDMVQNHLFQILSILTMEESDHQHQAQLEILKYLSIKQVLLGQYKGYKEEKDVAKDSTTETYAEVECRIENERWKGVPIYLRTGKKLNRREMYVIVKFKSIDDTPSNLLEIKIQPTEGVYFQFNIKKPGTRDEIETVKMNFCQSCSMEFRMNTPEAYERLLLEVFNQQREYFSTFELIQMGAHLIERIQKPEVLIYDEKMDDSLTEWIEMK